MFPLLIGQETAPLLVCRCCLLEQPAQCHSLGANAQLNGQLLALAPTLQLAPTDVICQLCLQRLHDALDFRQRCEDSERILRARHEQALDDALECLQREVGCLQQAKTASAESASETESESGAGARAGPVTGISTPLEPVDFGNLDLTDLFRGQEQSNALVSSWDSGILNTPVHLPATLERMEMASQQHLQRETPPQQLSLGQEQPSPIPDSSAGLPEPVAPPKRQRAPRTPTASRTPKSLRPCSECEKKFTRNFQLKLHMISVHGLGDGLRYQCEVCSKCFASRHSLRYHHTSLHSTERPFACELCQRRFVLRTQLISHARMHTGETKPRIFACSVCGKTWPTKSDLRTHMRSHDPDMSKRPYKCSKCSKAFFTRGHLNSHHLVHTGEKPYACSYCDKSYQSVGNLNNHTMRQHANLIEAQMNLKYTDSTDIES